MKNDYEIRGDVVAIFLNSRKHGRVETIVSASQLNRLKEFNFKWCLGNQSYVMSTMYDDKAQKTTVLLHRWLTNASKDLQVDHINHSTLDNTDSNLRVIKQKENNQNRKGANVNSKSGVRGVSWDKQANRWIAVIQLNKKTIHIGRFKTIEEAEVAARLARATVMTHSTN